MPCAYNMIATRSGRKERENEVFCENLPCICPEREMNTRQVEGLVTVKVVQVQVLSPALNSYKDLASIGHGRRLGYTFQEFDCGTSRQCKPDGEIRYGHCVAIIDD